MECQEVRERYVEALLAGQGPSPEVDLHVRACAECREDIRGLARTWQALGALPLVEPRPEVARRLERRIRWERVREVVASVDAWQRAALAGVAGFVVSVSLSLLVPYPTMVAICEAVAPNDLPTPVAYLVAGLLYGALPMLIGAGVEARAARVGGVLGAIEAATVFMAVLVPYVLLRCGEFAAPLLVSFTAGIGLGAVLGSLAGTGLRRWPAWVGVAR